MEKKQFRKVMMERRLDLASSERIRLSRLAQEALMGSPWFRSARMVLLYQAFRGEVQTDLIAAEAVHAGKRLVLPRVQQEPRHLWLHAYSGDPGTLVTGAFGILEPNSGWPLVGLSEVDLVVVPGVAFDLQGTRLGYGGGYYDRTLRDVRKANPGVVLVGLAYSFQLVEGLPRDSHDIPMDGVATDQGLVHKRNAGQ